MDLKILLFILIMGSSLFSVGFCDNFFEDSGMFAKLNWANYSYYAYLGESYNNNICYNDMIPNVVAFKYASGTYINTILTKNIPTSYINIYDSINFSDENMFIQNKSINFSVNTASGIFSATNSSGSQIQGKGKRFILSKTTTYNICLHDSNTCLNSTNPFISIYYKHPLTTFRDSNTDYLFNGSININYTNTIYNINKVPSGEIPANFNLTSNDIKNYRNGNLIGLYIYKDLPYINNNFSSPQKYTIYKYPSDIGIISYQNTSETNIYDAYLLYGSSLIVPKWNIYFTTYGSMNPYIVYNRYDSTTLKTKLMGNVATIIQDENGICYFAPPYTPSNYSLTYSISVYQTPCSSEGGGGYEGIITFPLLPNHINCGTDGTQYLSNITYDTDVLFEQYITYKNASVIYNSSLASSLFSNITITNETSIIDIKVNNRTRCYWNDETSVLGFELPFNEITNQLIGIPLLIVAVGLSMVNPFVFVFVFVVNDMFSLISIEMIFFLAIATGIMSFVANWNGERNFKVLIILFLLASAYLVQVSTLAPTIAGAELVELNILIEAIETLFSGISTGENLANIIVSILPTFLLNFIILVLKLPAILISIIFASLEAISPLAVAPLRYFEGALIVGAYVFIMLKAYEMGRNMFKSV